jgi:hypothetical protein
VADVLDRAADLLEQPGKWTQGAAARTADGEMTFAADPAAACFCMWGAIARVSDDYEAIDCRPIRMITQPLGCAATPGNLGRYNDKLGRTQAEVVAALRSAATAARTGEGK